MTQTTSRSKTFDLVVTRVFDAEVARVWRSWTDGEQVRRWWGPHGFTTPIAQMDVREGGRSLVCMRPPKEFGGEDMYNSWTYQKVQPLERLEFTLQFVDRDGQPLDPAQLGLPAGIPREVPHVITFKSLGAGRTEMTVNELGYTSAQAHDQSKAGLEDVLDKMAATFATKDR